MHELSIAMSIVEMAEEESDQRGGARVNAVHLKLGRLAGVVKDALLSSYELACEGSVYRARVSSSKRFRLSSTARSVTRLAQLIRSNGLFVPNARAPSPKWFKGVSFKCSLWRSRNEFATPPCRSTPERSQAERYGSS